MLIFSLPSFPHIYAIVYHHPLILFTLIIIYVEPRKVLPILKTDEPICPEGKLSCGNGECIEKELFCNDKPDCKDESDENACSKYNMILAYIDINLVYLL